MNFKFTDFHAHVLPNADHGSSSLETSLSQLNLAASHGVDSIIATPHFYPDRHTVDGFLKLRDASYENLAANISDGMPKIFKGAEVLICDGIERLEGIDKLCIQGTNILLLELPFSVYKSGYRDSVIRLIKNGFRVVLAHVDRYEADSIESLAEVGALMQLNASALTSLRIKPKIKDWLKYGAVVALGSDIHGADKQAYKRFEKARKRILKLGVEGSILELSQEIIRSNS